MTFQTQLYVFEETTTTQFACLQKLFGTSYGFEVCCPKDQKKDGEINLGILEKINVIDYYSVGASRTVDRSISNEDAPEMENKIFFLSTPSLCSCPYGIITATSK